MVHMTLSLCCVFLEFSPLIRLHCVAGLRYESGYEMNELWELSVNGGSWKYIQPKGDFTPKVPHRGVEGRDEMRCREWQSLVLAGRHTKTCEERGWDGMGRAGGNERRGARTGLEHEAEMKGSCRLMSSAGTRA